MGVIANDFARASEFGACVTKLLTPKGSSKEWVIGGDWCGARNELAKRCLDEGYDYLWFMDDDHSFAPELLQKLLQSSIDYDLPIVNPLCLARIAPFPLVTYAKNPDPESEMRYLPISMDGVPEEGIVELEAGGCAGMLIRRDVLEATRNMSFAPWSEENPGWHPVQDRWFEYGDVSEDIVFCQKVKTAGFKIYADLSCRLGHITTAVIWPAVNEGEWVTGITVGRDMTINVERAEVLVAAQELEFSADEEIPLAVDVDSERQLYDSPPARPQVIEPPPGIVPPIGIGVPEEPPVGEAERIEIWIDDEFRWWWRAIGHDGHILKKDSGINEMTVIGAAHIFYPGAPVHQVQRESDDSRNLRQYRVGQRMWDR